MGNLLSKEVVKEMPESFTRVVSALPRHYRFPNGRELEAGFRSGEFVVRRQPGQAYTDETLENIYVYLFNEERRGMWDLGSERGFTAETVALGNGTIGGRYVAMTEHERFGPLVLTMLSYYKVEIFEYIGQPAFFKHQVAGLWGVRVPPLVALHAPDDISARRVCKLLHGEILKSKYKNRICPVCAASTCMRCAACGMICYCSEECNAYAWEFHQVFCRWVVKALTSPVTSP